MFNQHPEFLFHYFYAGESRILKTARHQSRYNVHSAVTVRHQSGFSIYAESTARHQSRFIIFREITKRHQAQFEIWGTMQFTN